MALPALAFSDFFRDSGKMKGTVPVGGWKIPRGNALIFCSGNGSVEESRDAEKLFSVPMKSRRVMRVSDLSDKEAIIAGRAGGSELRASVKKRHGRKDSGTVAFVEWE